MPDILLTIASAVGYGVAAASVVYAAVALWRLRSLSETVPSAGDLPPVTVFKPVRGAESNLALNLRSFCEQDYPEFQILFGVRDPNDPAIPIVEALVREFPQRGAALVVDPTVIGSNYKIANVVNMLPRAKHDLFVIADADCRVGRDYLAAVAACFRDPAVGAVTCVYKGAPLTASVADRLGTMFINEGFLPSVRVALLIEPLRYCFGATMAVRRAVLDQVGGMARLAAYLADDYMLGRLVADAGYRVVLAPQVVEVMVAESGWRGLWAHELRWARTMRTVRPAGYAMGVITDAVPLTLLWAAATGLEGPAVGLVAAALSLRILTHFVARNRLQLGYSAAPWLVPIRDIMTFVLRVASFTGRRVAWQNHDFMVRPDGRMIARK